MRSSTRRSRLSGQPTPGVTRAETRRQRVQRERRRRRRMPKALVGANIALLTAIALLVGYLVTPHGSGGGSASVNGTPVALESEVQAVASATASADSLVKTAAGSGSAG